MARLVMCGWESGHPEEIGTGIIVVMGGGAAGSFTIVSPSRNGLYALRFSCTTGQGQAGSVIRSIPLPGSPAEVWCRVGVKATGNFDIWESLFTFLSLVDGATRQISFGWDAKTSFALRVYRGGTLIASGGSIPTSEFACFECHVIIHGTSGVVQAWMNGMQVINFSGNTLSSATTRITDIEVGVSKIVEGVGGGSTQQTHIVTLDDLAVNDTTGSVNTGRIGQGGIFALRPTADTGEKDWTPSTGSDNFARVNSVPPIGDASYVSAANSGDLDLYELPNLGGGEIDAVAAMAVSRVASGAGRELAPVLRSGAVTAIGSAFSLTNTYSVQQQLYELDPNTGAAWTLTAVNSVQCGVALTS